MTISIETFEYNQDNLGFLLNDSETGITIAIDAGSEEKICKILQRRGWKLSHIFITHYDWDHTDDILPLKSRYNARVYGPKAQADKIEGLDELLIPGQSIKAGNIELQTIDTCGHTKGHISFYEPVDHNLFCGDALFSLGCGRLRECEAKIMWEGLKRLRQLPDDTMVYCGHEYSAANAKFALSIDPQNVELKQRTAQITALRATGKPTIPFNLGQDKKANPFLRADDPALALKFDMPDANPDQVFAAIRKAKDGF